MKRCCVVCKSKKSLVCSECKASYCSMVCFEHISHECIPKDTIYWKNINGVTNENAAQKKTIYKDTNCMVTIYAINSGKAYREDADRVSTSVICIEGGHGTITLDNTDVYTLIEGTQIIIPPNVTYIIHNTHPTDPLKFNTLKSL